MKKNRHIWIAGFAAVILIVVFFLAKTNESRLTESEAVSVLKNAYPEFRDYPNDNLPPQSIRTEKGENGWYVAFVQEGSGRPIIQARCFFAKNDKSTQDIGTFSPSSAEDIGFSLKTCNQP